MTKLEKARASFNKAYTLHLKAEKAAIDATIANDKAYKKMLKRKAIVDMETFKLADKYAQEESAMNEADTWAQEEDAMNEAQYLEDLEERDY